MLVFIISWAGQHENALLIAENILKATDKVSIVYSDPDPNFRFNAPCNLIKRPDHLFWEDKFKSCLDAAGNDGLLIIHADCTCDDWALLVNRCRDVSLNFKDIGVWAPHIDGTYWNLNVSGIFALKNTHLVASALTDGIVFYLDPMIVNRMRQVTYGKNKFGWGIDLLYCAASHVNNKLVVIDTSVKVHHPRDKRGYNEIAAKMGVDEFMNQFSVRERIEFELLKAYVQFNHAKIATHRRKIKQKDKDK